MMVVPLVVTVKGTVNSGLVRKHVAKPSACFIKETKAHFGERLAWTIVIEAIDMEKNWRSHRPFVDELRHWDEIEDFQRLRGQSELSADDQGVTSRTLPEKDAELLPRL